MHTADYYVNTAELQVMNFKEAMASVNSKEWEKQ